LKDIFVVLLVFFTVFSLGFVTGLYVQPSRPELEVDFGADFDSKFNDLSKGTLFKIADELGIDVLSPENPFGNISVASYTHEGEFVNHLMALVSYGITSVRAYDSEKMSIVMALESMTPSERKKSRTLQNYYID